MAQATVFNPTTGERKAVDVGDPNAFQGGFVLETKTDSFDIRQNKPVSGTQGMQAVQNQPVNQPVVQSGQQATVVNPATGERKAVNVGDPNAFQGGFVLETTPPRQEPTPAVTIPKTITQDDFTAINDIDAIGTQRSETEAKILSRQKADDEAFAALSQFNLGQTREDLISDTNLEGLQSDLVQTDNALRTIEDDLNKRFEGRDISVSEFQAELADRSQPLLKQRQLLADQINQIQDNITSDLGAAQQQFENNLALYQQKVEAGQDAFDNELQLFQTLSQIPESQTMTLSDGTTLSGLKQLTPDIQYITKDDGLGNTSIAFWDQAELQAALAEGRSPEITTVSLSDFSKDVTTPTPEEQAKITAEATEEKKQREEAAEATKAKIFLIDSLIDSKGLASSVGTTPFTRTAITAKVTGEKQNFIGGVEQLIDQEFLDKLITVKSAGATFGALSNAEGNALRSAATKIGTWRIRKGGDPDGKVTGYNIDEKSFVKELETIQNLAEKALKRSGGAQYDSLNDYYENNETEREKIELMIKENPNLTDEDILQIVQPSFNNDLSKSENYLGNFGQITGFGSSLWEHGLDVDLAIGDPVTSPVSGKVVFVGENGGFGNQVQIEDANGNTYWLSHLDSTSVKKGDTIAQGASIGKGGNTGKTIPGKGGDGSHLDITVKLADGSFATPQDIKNSLA